MLEGLSINGTWPAGLPVALGLVLLTILAVQILGSGVRRGNPARGEGRSQGADCLTHSRQVLGERYARGDLTTEDYQERLRVLSRGV